MHGCTIGQAQYAVCTDCMVQQLETNMVCSNGEGLTEYALGNARKKKKKNKKKKKKAKSNTAKDRSKSLLEDQCCKICGAEAEEVSIAHWNLDCREGMCDCCFLAIQTEQWQIRAMDLTTPFKQKEALCREGSLVKVNVWDGDDTAMRVVIGFIIKKSDNDTGKITGNHWDIKYEAEPNLGYMTRSGQAIACNVRRGHGGAGRYFVRYVHSFWEPRAAEQVQTVVVKKEGEDGGEGEGNAEGDGNDDEDERTTHLPVCMWACGLGSRVAIMHFEENEEALVAEAVVAASETKAKESEDLATTENEHADDKPPPVDVKNVVRSGTVVGYVPDDTGGLYDVRIDNSSEVVRLNLTPQNSLPECMHAHFSPGQRLMVLDSSRQRNGVFPWVDASVVKYLGRSQGSRYKLKIIKNSLLVVKDLNRLNHMVQKLDSVDEFEKQRRLYRTHILLTRRRVVDSITSRSLDIVDQTVNVGVESGTDSRVTALASMKNLAVHLSSPSATRDQGAFDAQPVLVTAAAGTGKTWGVQQLEYCLASKPSTLEGLPFVIRGQDLSNMVSRLKQKVSDEDGAALIIQYIKEKFKDNIKRQNMLLQSLSSQTLVLIFDGVDEVLELNECVQRLFAETLVAMRYRFVVTSRPIGVKSSDGDSGRFKSGLIVIGLQPLTHEQIQFSVQQQLQGDEFFQHLFAFKKLREEQDRLYYEELAPSATTRKMLSHLGKDYNRLLVDPFAERSKMQYDSEMRQRVVDGSRFVAIRTDKKLLSTSVAMIDDILHRDDLMAKMQAIVRDKSIPDGQPMEDAVQKLSPKYFGVRAVGPRSDCTVAADSSCISQFLPLVFSQCFVSGIVAMFCGWFLVLAVANTDR